MNPFSYFLYTIIKNVQTLKRLSAAVTRTLPDGGKAKECSICKSEMPSWTREGHSCWRVKASTLVPWHLWLKTSSRVANLCSVTLKIPTYFALIEWILYGIHAWSVRTVSNLNQKIKLLRHCSCKLTLFFLLWLLSASAIYFTTSVEIKIIVELMQPQESNYIAIIPFGCRLIEVVIFSRNTSCCVLKGFDQCCVLRDK